MRDAACYRFITSVYSPTGWTESHPELRSGSIVISSLLQLFLFHYVFLFSFIMKDFTSTVSPLDVLVMHMCRNLQVSFMSIRSV